MNITDTIREFLNDNLDNENLRIIINDEESYLCCTPEGEVQLQTLISGRTFEVEVLRITREINENEYYFVYFGDEYRLYIDKSPFRKDYIVRYYKPGSRENLAYTIMGVNVRGDWKKTIREVMEERIPGAKILCVGEVIRFFNE